MQITRHNHLRSMVKTAPLLVFLYVLQVIAYKKLVPPHIFSEIPLFLGVGLSSILFGFYLYDEHHKITAHANFLEVSLKPIGLKDEILYREIAALHIVKARKAYGTLKISLSDGRSLLLRHIDDPEKVLNFFEDRRKNHPI